MPRAGGQRVRRGAGAWLALGLLGLAGATSSPADEPAEPIDDRAAAETAETATSEQTASQADAAPDESEEAAIRARRASVEAARERERSVRHLEELELRVGDDYLEEHRVKVTARLPLRHPGEVSAQRRMYAADARLAESRLAREQLVRESDACFPAVEAQARREERAIFDAYAARQAELVAHNAAGRQSGVVSEIDATRFELERRVRLLEREPVPAGVDAPDARALPLLIPPPSPLALDDGTLREAVATHHPAIELHRASAERYDAMAARARSRGKPWIKFIDVNYLHRSGETDADGSQDPSQNGGGAKVAFTIPFGGGRANTRHYDALGRAQRIEADARVEDQMLRGRLALESLHAFESRTERLLELLMLADDAEVVADRWWRSKRGTPAQIADLVDEAFEARRAVLEAREEAGVARCTLLAMTGVAAEDWPRATRAPETDPGAANDTGR